MRIPGGVYAFAFGGLFLLALSGQANGWTVQLCPEEIARLEEQPQLGPPLPIGCEMVDCCPGCQGTEPLEWRVRVTGNRLAGAELHFEGGSGVDAKTLKLSGSARQLESRITVGKGQSRIGNLPRGSDGKIAIAFIKPVMAKVAPKGRFSLKRLMGRAGPDDADAEGGVSADLYQGGVLVSSISIGYAAVPCPPSLPPPQPAGDLLFIDNNGTRDNTVVVVDSRTGAGGDGCSNDRVLRAVERTDLPNQLANAGCNSEIAVFAGDRAMALSAPVTVWTDAPGDTHRVPLDPIVVAPVSVWFANTGVASQAGNDFANANLLYRQNKVGVQFAPTYTDVSADAAATTAIGIGCANASTVKGSAWFTADRLNVYYVNDSFTGVTCHFDPNIIYIGTTANIASLAHEFGHAFSLRPSGQGGHTNGLPGFDRNNIMWGGGPSSRNRFTLGQAFRINVDTRSKLNLNGTRTGPTRACIPLANTPQCPPLTLDWIRP